jgi:hypothetical protein
MKGITLHFLSLAENMTQIEKIEEDEDITRIEFTTGRTLI